MIWQPGDLAVCIRAYENIPLGTVLVVSYVGKNTLEFKRTLGCVTRGLYSQSRFEHAKPGTPVPEEEIDLELPLGYGMWTRNAAKFAWFGSLQSNRLCVWRKS